MPVPADRLLLPRCNYGTKQKVILHWLKQLITVFLPYIKTVLSLPERKDEVEAMYKAAVAAERAAYEQYQMAVDGAQKEDKESAASMVNAARSTVEEVSALLVDAPADSTRKRSDSYHLFLNVGNWLRRELLL